MSDNSKRKLFLEALADAKKQEASRKQTDIGHPRTEPHDEERSGLKRIGQYLVPKSTNKKPSIEQIFEENYIDLGKPVIRQSNMGQPELEKPMMKQPDVIRQPELAKPVMRQPDVIRQSDLAKPVMRQPDVIRQSDLTKPVIRQPKIKQHEIGKSTMRQFKARQFAVGQSWIKRSEIKHPDVEQFDTEQLKTEQYVPIEPWVDYRVADDCLHLLHTIFLERPVSMDHLSGSSFANKFAFYHEDKRLMQRRQGMLLRGNTNNGKTRILLKFKEVIQEKTGNEFHVGAHKQKVSLHPVIYVSTPPSKMQFLFRDILQKLDAPYPNRLSKDELLGMAVDALVESEVRMLILDEFQNTLEGEKNNLPLLLKSLLHISNKAGVSLVLAGTPEIEVAIATQAPMRNRLLRFPIPEWRNNGEFQNLIKSMEEARNLRCTPPLHSPDIARQIFNMTEGLIGEVANLLFQLSTLSDNGLLNAENLSEVSRNWLNPSERKRYR